MNPEPTALTPAMTTGTPGDVFTEAAISRAALLAGADAVENLPQDHECDPGRGDAVILLRRLAAFHTTEEQPTGVTWEARAAHTVRLYATVAIERDDALAEAAKLREQLADRDRDLAHRITTMGKARGWSTWAAEYIHPDREFLDTGKRTTADKAAAAGMTPTEYREHSHHTATEEVRTAARGMYAEAGARVLAALDGNPTGPEAHPPLTEYVAELRESDGIWMSLGGDTGRSAAEKRRAGMARRYPDTATRTVRRTTTYTVEPDPTPAADPTP